jgi:4a-hydroxytetrahydrobiopterin dehydratase
MTAATLELARERCRPIGKDEPSLPREAAAAMLQRLPGWSMSADGKEISKDYVMKDFSSGVRLAGEIAETANREDHHPDLHLTGYRRFRAVLSTHSIGGLSMNDFILAAKIEELPKDLQDKH